MRNLKRVLSLALAALMLMGMMVVGAGAASKDFTDSDEITNVEAVDVMVGLGVLEGGNNGDFQPNSILTREQAAKIICYMLLGEEAAEKLTTNYSIFSDVPANRWSAPYISYCVNLGILAGDGAGHFFPEGKLTGVAFAKMLMVCLGYSADREHYVGNNWEINTSAAAIAAGVAPKALDLSKELSRQDAAQMAFNTLTATMVEYLNDNTIIIGNTTVSTVGKASAVRQGVYDDNMRADYLQFAEKYFPYLILTQGMTDVFGRPAHIWTYKNKDIGTYTDNDLLVAEYTDTVKGKDAYADIGYSAITQYGLSVYVDGAESKAITKADLTKNNNSPLSETGKGVLTQVYVDHETKEITFVIINTYLAEANADYNEKTETVQVSAFYGVDTKSGTPKALTSTHRLSSEDFDVTGLKAGDKVMVTMAAPNHDGSKSRNEYSIESVVAPEVVADSSISSYTGEASSYDTKIWTLTSVTVDGEKYSTAAKAVDEVELLYNYAKEQLENATYNLYLDPYGYVLGIETVEVPDNYVFVVGYDTGSNVLAQAIDKALIILPDGTMKTVNATDVKLGSAAQSALKLNANSDNSAVNTWFTYTVDADGTYVLRDVVAKQGSTNVTTINSKNVTLGFGEGKTTSTPGTLSYVYGNDYTTYITVDANDSVTGNVTTSGDKSGSIVGVDAVYTGVKNVDITGDNLSSFPSTFGAKPSEALKNFQYGYNDTDNHSDYNNVFFVYSGSYITCAIVVGEDNASDKNMTYLTSGITAKTWDNENKVYVYTYEAIVNGELTTVKSEVHADNRSKELQAGYLYEASVNKLGYIDGMTFKAEVAPGAMNTTDNAKNGYTRKSNLEGVDTNKIVDVELKGATLWVIDQADEDNYVILNSDAVFFVQNSSKSSASYEMYTNADAAISATDADNIASIDSVTAICDSTTGFAKTVIIDVTYKNDTNKPTANYPGTMKSIAVANKADGTGLDVTMKWDMGEALPVSVDYTVVATNILTGASTTRTFTQNVGTVATGNPTTAKGSISGITMNALYTYKVTAVANFTDTAGNTYAITGVWNNV